MLDLVLDYVEFTAKVEHRGALQFVHTIGGCAHLAGDINCYCGVVELVGHKPVFKVLGHQFLLVTIAAL
jgi:hypothetical protein